MFSHYTDGVTATALSLVSQNCSGALEFGDDGMTIVGGAISVKRLPLRAGDPPRRGTVRGLDGWKVEELGGTGSCYAREVLRGGSAEARRARLLRTGAPEGSNATPSPSRRLSMPSPKMALAWKKCDDLQVQRHA